MKDEEEISSSIPAFNTIKNYWETRTPGIKHSVFEPGTIEFLNELEEKRYNRHYAYLLESAEFDQYDGKDVLEIGCGMGIDLTEKAIQNTRSHFSHRGMKGTFLTMNTEKLDFPDNSFDLVYSFGVLHHTQDTQKAINEVNRVLKPGGKAIIMLYHKGFRYYFKIHLYYGILKGENYK